MIHAIVITFVALTVSTGTPAELLDLPRVDTLASRACVLSSDMPGIGFEESAARAVRKWTYRPVTMGGAPFATIATVSVNFSLDGD